MAEFCERYMRVDDLDGGHPHRSCWFEVDTQIVEEDTCSWFDVECFAGKLIEPRRWFAYTGLRRFDDHFEELFWPLHVSRYLGRHLR